MTLSLGRGIRFSEWGLCGSWRTVMARFLIIIGIAAICLGLALAYLPRIPYVGRLPGDIYIKRDNFVLYFPLATSIIISIILSLVLYVIGRR